MSRATSWRESFLHADSLRKTVRDVNARFSVLLWGLRDGKPIQRLAGGSPTSPFMSIGSSNARLAFPLLRTARTRVVQTFGVSIMQTKIIFPLSILGLIATAAVACGGSASSGNGGAMGDEQDVRSGTACGGNVANPGSCSAGYECIRAPGTLPDVGGKCTKTDGRACGGNIKDPPPACPHGFTCTGAGGAPVGDVGGTCHKS